MIIRIRNTRRRFFDEDRNELVGQCSFPAPTRMAITVSIRHNKTVNKYAATMLHELLHAWINILSLRGFRTEHDREEKFVGEVEQVVVKKFKKYFGRR